MGAKQSSIDGDAVNDVRRYLEYDYSSESSAQKGDEEIPQSAGGDSHSSQNENSSPSESQSNTESDLHPVKSENSASLVAPGLNAPRKLVKVVPPTILQSDALPSLDEWPGLTNEVKPAAIDFRLRGNEVFIGGCWGTIDLTSAVDLKHKLRSTRPPPAILTPSNEVEYRLKEREIIELSLQTVDQDRFPNRKGLRGDIFGKFLV